MIANPVMILHGSVRSMLGFSTNLSGVSTLGSPAKELKEGATHSFVHLGKRVTLTISEGKTVVSHKQGHFFCRGRTPTFSRKNKASRQCSILVF